MRRLTAAGLLPERAGQPVKAWAHISLVDLLRLDGSSALQEQWTEQVRARWAARRAQASESDASDGAWLDGDAAAAIACDAAMTPVVTGEVDIDALEDLVRLCVELGKLRQDGEPRPDTTAAWAAIEQAVIGKAVDLLSGPGGLASFLRRRQLGVRLGGPSLPLDIGYAETVPAGIRNAVLLRDRHCQWAGGCTQPAGACELHHTRHKAHGGKTSVDAGRQPGRDDDGVEQEQDQSAPQPRPTRPRRVTEAVGYSAHTTDLREAGWAGWSKKTLIRARSAVMASLLPEPRRRRPGPGRYRAAPSLIRSCPAIRRPR